MLCKVDSPVTKVRTKAAEGWGIRRQRHRRAQQPLPQHSCSKTDSLAPHQGAL